jgi:hypothetical protein
LADADGVKRSQSLVERDRALGHCIGWGSDDDATVLEGCQRLLVSTHRKIESFGEYAAPRDSRRNYQALGDTPVAAKCWKWLAALDDFRNWLIREAA